MPEELPYLGQHASGSAAQERLRDAADPARSFFCGAEVSQTTAGVK